MGKNPDLSAEELEFIFDVFRRGLSYKDEIEETEFPKRCSRTITSLKRNYNAAKKVLEMQLKKELDPIIIKRRERHHNDLVTITKTLLANGLDTVDWHYIEPPNTAKGVFYRIVEGDNTVDLSMAELSSRLEENWDAAVEEHGDYNVECLIGHLLADHDEIVEASIYSAIVNQPYEIIETLRLATRRRYFNGSCLICEAWC